MLFADDSVNAMGLLLEMTTNTIVLVAQPISILKLLCIIGLRTICFFTHTWLLILKAIINFHVNVLRKIMIWTIAFVTLPMRVLTAIQRERLVILQDCDQLFHSDWSCGKLEMHLYEMQRELENLAWNKKEIEERLQNAIKDRRIMASVLDELEEEHEKAIAKIELLESELLDLKDENLHLKEVRGKGKWNFETQDDHGSDVNARNNDKCRTPSIDPSLKSGCAASEVILEDLRMHKDSWDNKNKAEGQDSWDNKNKAEGQPHNYVKLQTKSSGFTCPYPLTTLPHHLSVDEALYQRREVALSQSLFSATLSLLVGMIIWKAEDPCMPLVISLFTVVGMSLKSVVQFFSTIKNRPASDAVALLSFNWFILGSLTYPTLPRVAHVLVPLFLRLLDKMITSFGLPSLLQMD